MKYSNEKQVLDALKIKSWKKLSKEKFLEYVAIIPDASEEVRLKVLERLPECLGFTKDLLETMKAQQENIANHNTKVTEKIIESLNAIQKSLDNMGNKPKLNFKERQYICEKQMEIAKIYVALDSSNKDFLQKLWNGLVAFGGAALLLVGAVFGIKFIKGK